MHRRIDSLDLMLSFRFVSGARNKLSVTSLCLTLAWEFPLISLSSGVSLRPFFNFSNLSVLCHALKSNIGGTGARFESAATFSSVQVYVKGSSRPCTNDW